MFGGVLIFGTTGVLAQSGQPHYEQPTLAKFSQLYWAISALDPMNDEHIDTFLMINECDIYRDYYHNEFEWKDIREAARDHVVSNKKNFPLRFEFVNTIRLKDYNFERGGFEIHDDYKVLGTRRFQVYAKDYNAPVCNTRRSGVITQYYPGILTLELSRPVNLEFIKVEEELAREYIKKKSEQFEGLQERYQNQANVYALRDVHVVMKVKIYAYKGPDRAAGGQDVAVVMAVLEGLEIYADEERKMLMHSENFRMRSRIAKSESGIQGASAGGQGGAPERPEEGMLLD